MALSVVICGEGPTDAGKEGYGTHEWIDGPAVAFIKSASSVDLEITGISRTELMGRHKIQKLKHKKSHGHATKAERLAKYAAMNGFDVAICYIDCDRNEHRQQSDLLREGFANSGVKIKCIPMTPKAMIENWLLADSEAYVAVLHKRPSSPPLPRHPEDIWGDVHDPQSNHPKKVLERVLNQFNKKPSNHMYDIALHSNPETMRQRCPISYKPFFEEIQSIEHS